MTESEDERNRATVNALRAAVAEAVTRLTPETEPALRYTVDTRFYSLSESAEDSQ